MDSFDEKTRLIAFIREEMRFELDELHSRINALINAEAFLTIAFTMALGSADARWNAGLRLVAPMLCLVGLLLAALCWPGVSTGVRIINEWNSLLIAALQEAPEATRGMWRRSFLDGGKRGSDATHRRSMVFAQAVPVVFAVAWTVFAAIAFRAL